MAPDIAIHLAVDVLEEQFGVNVGKVGSVLLERGRLSVEEILLFVRQMPELDEEPLSFQQVRNAMLVMVQHGLVEFEPIMQAGKSSVLHVYSIKIEEIIARLRYPHFMEYVDWRYGSLAMELLFAVLRYGRASGGVAVSEACDSYVTPKGEKATPEEAETLLRQLVTERVLRPVKACSSSAPAEPLASASPKRAAQDSDSRKRKLEGMEETDEADRGPADKVPPIEQSVVLAAKQQVKDTIYCCDRRSLQLCLWKNALCRLAEEKYSPAIAKVFLATLSSVTLDQPSRWMQFNEIEEQMQKLESTGGRDPQRMREKLRQTLDSLSMTSDSLLRRRSLASDPSLFEWQVEREKAHGMLAKSLRSQLIREWFGIMGLRIFNLLTEESCGRVQRLEENQILGICMLPQEQGRTILNAMVQASLVHWQQVPRSSDGAIANSFWLYYVDPVQVMAVLEERALRAILNMRIRFRVESARLVPLERSIGSLNAKERGALFDGRRREDILERSGLVLHAVLLACSKQPWDGRCSS
eukprot:TRINITY_DN97071_c0_g1_i1.p1 TRINITY_DN97071_c0_g1~~TRINITY_DN97071_c0_g1_i1.p1  ORF type:complete len:527 (-),score=121.50 TRINITY_DN97071_c0_g1_i1:28-1608(-)